MGGPWDTQGLPRSAEGLLGYPEGQGQASSNILITDGVDTNTVSDLSANRICYPKREGWLLLVSGSRMAAGLCPRLPISLLLWMHGNSGGLNCSQTHAREIGCFRLLHQVKTGTVCRRGGVNGFFTINISLLWWFLVLKTSGDRKVFDSMVLDVSWVLDQMIAKLKPSQKWSIEEADTGGQSGRGKRCVSIFWRDRRGS